MLEESGGWLLALMVHSGHLGLVLGGIDRGEHDMTDSTLVRCVALLAIDAMNCALAWILVESCFSAATD